MKYDELSAIKAKNLIERKNAVILGIETSCDETSAAIVRNGREVLSNIVSTQLDIHRKYGGVVPEIASRKHIESVDIVIDEAFEKAGMSFNDIDAIAVTYGPGLVGALLVGVAAAKSIAYALNLPLIGINHIEGHIHASLLAHKELEPPFLSLVVSGGHTFIVVVEDYCKYTVLSRTRDDAAGEAYDKVGRLLGLPYPGGPEIDRLALEGNNSINFPSAYLPDGDFSFSGLKTAVINYLNTVKTSGRAFNHADVAASFQSTVIHSLIKALFHNVETTGIKKVALAGGVTANRGLRKAVEEEALRSGVSLYLPPFELCTDNAAMITSAAYYRLMRGDTANLRLNAAPSLNLE